MRAPECWGTNGSFLTLEHVGPDQEPHVNGCRKAAWDSWMLAAGGMRNMALCLTKTDR